MKRLRVLVPLGALVAAALALRLWGIDRHLPYVYHPDEPVYETIILRMFRSGDPNPHFFNYPSLFFYLNVLACAPFYLAGKLMGVFATRADLPLPVSLAMGVTKAPLPATILVGRALSATTGALTVALAFAAGRRVSGRAAAGWIAAVLVAVSPTHVIHSRFITPDVFVTFFAAASMWALIHVYRTGRTRDWLVAGAMIGLTASCKYNGGLLVIALVLAWALRRQRAPGERRDLVRALFLAGFAFLATTPFALLDPLKFLAGVRREGRHYSTGHAGMEGDTWAFYLRLMMQRAPLVYLVALGEALRGLIARSRQTLLLASFPLVYLAFIGSFVVRNDRTFLPATPFLFVLAGCGMVALFDRARRIVAPGARRAALAGLVALAALGLASPVAVTVGDTLRLAAPDGREAARAWIADSLPAGAAIAIESYAPFVDPARHRVVGVLRAIDHPPEWYADEGFDYVVVSEPMFGRFLKAPERYPGEVEAYRALFARLEPVARFPGGGYEVRVLRVPRGTAPAAGPPDATPPR